MIRNRAIVIFPKFSNIKNIDEIREKYDPLYNFIAPHITLVFPFQSEFVKDELIEHIENQLKEVTPFQIIAKGITGASDGYVFLDIKKGNDNIIEIHDKLYTGILKPFHNRYIPYVPHITVGKLEDEKCHKAVVEELSDFDVEFRTVIEGFTIEVIDDSEKSIIEYEYKL